MSTIKVFVISDVHSFYEPMMTALNKCGFDMNNPSHLLICCGDMFDRGPDAVKVLRFLQEMARMERLVYITGNHEDLLFDLLQSMQRGEYISSHHFSNGTVDTVYQFTGLNRYDLLCRTYDRQKMESDLAELTNFIKDNCVDYAELGNYVFVHGWFPCYNGLDNFEDATPEDWKDARWYNGMNMWRNPKCRISGKTVVCGHYHCSWGWSHLRHERKEFPNKGRPGWLSSFEPFIDEGIMAIDACTAYTGICNCVVLDI